MLSNQIFSAIAFLGLMALVAVAMPTERALAADTSLEYQITRAVVAWDGAAEPMSLDELREFYAKDEAESVGSASSVWEDAAEPMSLEELRAFYAPDEEVKGWSLPMPLWPGQRPY